MISCIVGEGVVSGLDWFKGTVDLWGRFFSTYFSPTIGSMAVS